MTDDIEEAMVAAVNAETSLTALIGNRIFPTGGRQNPLYPYVAFDFVDEPGADYLDGDANLLWPRYQLKVWAKTRREVGVISRALRSFFCPTPSAALTGAGLTFTATDPGRLPSEEDEVTRAFGGGISIKLWYERT